MSDYHRKYSGIKEYWSSIWYAIAVKTESRHDANIVITQVVIMMTTCGDYSDDKVRIMTISDFSWSSEHQDHDCNTLPLQRFLESESLSHYRVLYTLVRVTDSA